MVLNGCLDELKGKGQKVNQHFFEVEIPNFEGKKLDISKQLIARLVLVKDEKRTIIICHLLCFLLSCSNQSTFNHLPKQKFQELIETAFISFISFPKGIEMNKWEFEEICSFLLCHVCFGKSHTGKNRFRRIW